MMHDDEYTDAYIEYLGQCWKEKLEIVHEYFRADAILEGHLLILGGQVPMSVWARPNPIPLPDFLYRWGTIQHCARTKDTLLSDPFDHSITQAIWYLGLAEERSFSTHFCRCRLYFFLLVIKRAHGTPLQEHEKCWILAMQEERDQSPTFRYRNDAIRCWSAEGYVFPQVGPMESRRFGRIFGQLSTLFTKYMESERQDSLNATEFQALATFFKSTERNAQRHPIIDTHVPLFRTSDKDTHLEYAVATPAEGIKVPMPNLRGKKPKLVLTDVEVHSLLDKAIVMRPQDLPNLGRSLSSL